MDKVLVINGITQLFKSKTWVEIIGMSILFVMLLLIIREQILISRSMLSKKESKIMSTVVIVLIVLVLILGMVTPKTRTSSNLEIISNGKSIAINNNLTSEEALEESEYRYLLDITDSLIILEFYKGKEIIISEEEIEERFKEYITRTFGDEDALNSSIHNQKSWLDVMKLKLNVQMCEDLYYEQTYDSELSRGTLDSLDEDEIPEFINNLINEEMHEFYNTVEVRIKGNKLERYD